MKSNDKKYIKAFSDSLLIIFFTIMPTLFSWLSLSWSAVSPSYTSLYNNGQLFLYSISFLASSYVIYKQVNHDLFQDFGNALIAFLLLISLFYSAASLDLPSKPLGAILTLSIIFLIISILFLFHSQVISNKKIPPDIRLHRNIEQDKIEDALS